MTMNVFASAMFVGSGPKTGLPGGGDLRGSGAFLVRVRRHGAAQRGHEQVGVDADQTLG
jgi:hypothetical protein